MTPRNRVTHRERERESEREMVVMVMSDETFKIARSVVVTVTEAFQVTKGIIDSS